MGNDDSSKYMKRVAGEIYSHDKLTPSIDNTVERYSQEMQSFKEEVPQLPSSVSASPSLMRAASPGFLDMKDKMTGEAAAPSSRSLLVTRVIVIVLVVSVVSLILAIMHYITASVPATTAHHHTTSIQEPVAAFTATLSPATTTPLPATATVQSIMTNTVSEVQPGCPHPGSGNVRPGWNFIGPGSVDCSNLAYTQVYENMDYVPAPTEDYDVRIEVTSWKNATTQVELNVNWGTNPGEDIYLNVFGSGQWNTGHSRGDSQPESVGNGEVGTGKHTLEIDCSLARGTCMVLIDHSLVKTFTPYTFAALDTIGINVMDARNIPSIPSTANVTNFYFTPQD